MYKEPTITIVNEKLPQETVEYIIEHAKKNKQNFAFIKQVRYRPDEKGIFFFSNRYDKNYVHIW